MTGRGGGLCARTRNVPFHAPLTRNKGNGGPIGGGTLSRIIDVHGHDGAYKAPGTDTTTDQRLCAPASLAGCWLPKAFGYTLTCPDADGVRHTMQTSRILDALQPSITFLAAPTAEQGRCTSYPHRALNCCTCSPLATGMDKPAAAGFTAGCFAHLGAGLGTVAGIVCTLHIACTAIQISAIAKAMQILFAKEPNYGE